MKFAIINAYDVRNRGDRAIVEAQIGWIRRHDPSADIAVYSPFFEENAEVFGKERSFQPIISHSNGSGKLAALIEPLARRIRFATGQKEAAMTFFREADAVIMCGGGYLYSSPAPLVSRQLAFHCWNAQLALKLGKPVLTFPQSWGPLRKSLDRTICQSLANALPAIVTRGRASTKLLNEMGHGDKIIQLPDIVMALDALRDDIIPPKRQTVGRSLGIAPIDWGFDRDIPETEKEKYIEKLASIAAHWITQQKGKVTIIPQVVVDNHDDDRIPSARLRDILIERNLPVEYTPDLSWSEHWQLIANQDVFIGCRMHACIFSMVCGVPAVGLAYQPKFHELYEQIDNSRYSIDIEKFEPKIVSSLLEDLVLDERERERFGSGVKTASASVIEGMDSVWKKIRHESLAETRH